METDAHPIASIRLSDNHSGGPAERDLVVMPLRFSEAWPQGPALQEANNIRKALFKCPRSPSGCTCSAECSCIFAAAVRAHFLSKRLFHRAQHMPGIHNRWRTRLELRARLLRSFPAAVHGFAAEDDFESGAGAECLRSSRRSMIVCWVLASSTLRSTRRRRKGFPNPVISFVEALKVFVPLSHPRFHNLFRSDAENRA